MDNLSESTIVNAHIPMFTKRAVRTPPCTARGFWRVTNMSRRINCESPTHWSGGSALKDRRGVVLVSYNNHFIRSKSASSSRSADTAADRARQETGLQMSLYRKFMTSFHYNGDEFAKAEDMHYQQVTKTFKPRSAQIFFELSITSSSANQSRPLAPPRPLRLRKCAGGVQSRMEATCICMHSPVESTSNRWCPVGWAASCSRLSSHAASEN